jgi:hypothetical protein
MAYSDEWWFSVPELIKKTREFYTRNAAKNPNADLISATTQKIIVAREWQPALSHIQENFPRVLTELGVFYVPKTYEPGPMFVFPIRALDGTFPRAQTKPCEGSVLWGQGNYHWIGEKLVGPNWLGNDPETLKRIIERKEATLVEGPFDLLACRLLTPDLPIMTPLTKSISDKHEAYLRMLGVEKLNLLFDNERPDIEKGKDLGGGNLSMRVLKYKIKTMNVEVKLLKGSDPSAALKTGAGTNNLLSLLMGNEL